MPCPYWERLQAQERRREDSEVSESRAAWDGGAGVIFTGRLQADLCYWKAGSWVRRNQLSRTMWRENHLVARRARPRELMSGAGRRRPIRVDQSFCSVPKRAVSALR